MELVFEMLAARQFKLTDCYRKAFNQAGGVIGRSKKCDWVIPDHDRSVSNYHATVTYREGAFFLTDTSSNGIYDRAAGASLRKGEPVRIDHGNVYVLGETEIRALLESTASSFGGEVDRSQPAGGIIPDDAFLDSDPLGAIERQEHGDSQIDAPISPGNSFEPLFQHADYARIDRENLIVPQLIATAVPAESAPAIQAEACHGEPFWDQFGNALGLDLNGLDHAARETLAISAARLLKHSIDGLQQSLRTRSKLKNELRLAQTVVQGIRKNPLKFTGDTVEALGVLLNADRPGQLPAEQAVDQAFRDLQAHQVALLSASRSAIRGTLKHFSPQHLTLRFERDNKPLLNTSGSRWRAYGRYHQALCQDNDWSERLLAHDFAQAYEEQIRLLSTLCADHQG